MIKIFVLQYINLLLLLLQLVAVTFEKDAYKIDEDEDLKLKLRLDKTPGEEYNLQVFSVDNTAISELCMMSYVLISM